MTTKKKQSKVKTASDLSHVRRISSLIYELNYHNNLYYVEGEPEISDAAYDEMYMELCNYEDTHPELITEDSPTRRVGAPVDSITKAQHLSAMLSLKDVRTIDDVKKWQDKMGGKGVCFNVENKCDGISGNLIYKDGMLQSAITRGDGSAGEDITHLVRTIKDVPIQLLSSSKVRTIEVRVELMMYTRGLSKANELRESLGKKPLANTRNAIAGLMRYNDPAMIASLDLTAKAFDIGYCDAKYIPKTHSETISYLSMLGFSTLEDRVVCTTAGLKRAIDDIAGKRSSIDYDIDGVVIKLANIKHRKKHPAVSKNPGWAIAYKFPPTSENIKVTGVKWQCGKTGELHPVATVVPTIVHGVVISNVNLHNLDIIRALNVNVGDIVQVERANDVIPHIRKVVKKNFSGFIRPPNDCPCCNSKVIQIGPKSFCSNVTKCPDVIKRKLAHFVSRPAMAIDGIGPMTIETLYGTVVNDLSDIYRLNDTALKSINMKEKPAAKLLESIERSKTVTLARFLYSLSIYGLGQTNSYAIEARYKTLDNIMENITINDLKKIDGIGDEFSEGIWKGIVNMRHVIKDLVLLGVNVQDLNRTYELENNTYVITGSFDRPRSEIATALKDRGAKVSSSVSKRTTGVIVGENPGAKHQKALDLDIDIITESSLAELI